MTSYHDVNDRKVGFAGWPGPDLRPAECNSGNLARAIIAYRDRWQGHPHFPASPWSTRHGSVWLPELTHAGPNDSLTETDERPLYRTMRPAQINGTAYEANREVTFDGWPSDAGLEPVNAPARRITAYFSRYRHTGLLPSKPYDSAKQVVHLPPITELDQRSRQHEIPPASVRTVA
jgi:hypothetical protein